MGKLYIFITGFEAGYNWLMILAILMSAASIYYYLKLIMAMYFRTATHDVRIETSPAVRMVILVGILITVILGLFPGVITGLAS